VPDIPGAYPGSIRRLVSGYAIGTRELNVLANVLSEGLNEQNPGVAVGVVMSVAVDGCAVNRQSEAVVVVHILLDCHSQLAKIRDALLHPGSVLGFQ
jgi:hypothetical protein